MASYFVEKKSKLWVSMLVGCLDRKLKFIRVFVAIIGVYFYLIIETHSDEAIVIQFESDDEAKQWVKDNILRKQTLQTRHFWTHYYNPYATWLKEEFNIAESELLELQNAISLEKALTKFRYS